MRTFALLRINAYACIREGMGTNSLLADIEAFLAETGMSAAYFGFRAVRNYRLVDRLRQQATPALGRPARVWPDTEDRIRAFMAREREQRGLGAAA